jgi:hypothetical protein
MISDTVALHEIQEMWKGVDALRGRIQVSVLASFATGVIAPIAASDAAHNLPFLHACSVLNDVLAQMAHEGKFKCKSIFLGALVAASKTNLTWKNLPEVEKAVARRNDLAHRAEMLPRGECWQYIDAIREELRAWGIL